MRRFSLAIAVGVANKLKGGVNGLAGGTWQVAGGTNLVDCDAG